MQVERDPRHEVVADFAPDAEIGCVYTNGLAAVAASPIELICLDVPRQAVPSFHNCLNFLASRLEEGHAILPGQKVMRDGVYVNMIVGVNERTNRYLLGEYVLPFQLLRTPHFSQLRLLIIFSLDNYAVEVRADFVVGADVKLLLVVPMDRLPLTLSNGASW